MKQSYNTYIRTWEYKNKEDIMVQLINFFKILSDETRLKILILLYHRKLCVCELCSIMNESQPKISKHLARLRDIGLISDERQGQFIFYNLSFKNHINLRILEDIIESKEISSLIIHDLENFKQTNTDFKYSKTTREDFTK